MEEKFEKFIQACKILNKMGIVPALFGSMALYRIIGEKEAVGDIDILIPDEYLMEKFGELKEHLTKAGFIQDTTFPHQFKFEGEEIEFEPLYITTELMKVKVSELKIADYNGVKFCELSAENLLNFYRFAKREREEKLEKINRRIKYIEDYLK